MSHNRHSDHTDPTRIHPPHTAAWALQESEGLLFSFKTPEWGSSKAVGKKVMYTTRFPWKGSMRWVQIVWSGHFPKRLVAVTVQAAEVQLQTQGLGSPAKLLSRVGKMAIWMTRKNCIQGQSVDVVGKGLVAARQKVEFVFLQTGGEPLQTLGLQGALCSVDDEGDLELSS